MAIVPNGVDACVKRILRQAQEYRRVGAKAGGRRQDRFVAV